MATTSTPYSTVRPLMGAAPTWLGAADAERIESYRIYEDMYWNAPETFVLMQRGSESNPIYIPSAKVIIEATNRYLGVGFDYLVDPRVGTPADQLVAQGQLERLFKREMLWTKFSTQKRFGLIRGDAIWHIIGDAAKLPGSRISIYEVDPASYFPIYEDDNLDRLVGVHLVDQVEYEKKVVVRRQTYRKVPGTTTITTELALFEAGKWDDRDSTPYGEGSTGKQSEELKLVKQLVPVTPLDVKITALPVYQVCNMRTPSSPFGSSELRGLERISAAVNQGISDQELALALDGIGLYATTSGPPTDVDGNEVNWILGPGRVVEIDPETDFKRVAGVSSLPALEHVKFLLEEQRRAAGVPDIAAGMVDVTVAESGIALSLQLSPLLAKNAEKEQEMLGVYDHMLYDIVQMWLPTYEGVSPGLEVEVASIVQDAMPVNREARVAELLALLAAKVISAEYAREELTKYGYDFPAEMGEAIVAETTALTAATGYDPFASRVSSELEESTL